MSLGQMPIPLNIDTHLSCIFCSSECLSIFFPSSFTPLSSSSFFFLLPFPLTSLFCHCGGAFTCGAVFHCRPLFSSIVLKSDYDHQTGPLNIQQSSGCCFHWLHRNSHHRCSKCLSLQHGCVQVFRGAGAQLNKSHYLTHTFVSEGQYSCMRVFLSFRNQRTDFLMCLCACCLFLIVYA